jgi:sugar lactone lactonase YvrE
MKYKLIMNFNILYILILIIIFFSHLEKVDTNKKKISLEHFLTISDEEVNGPFIESIQDASISTNNTILILDSSADQVHVYNQNGDYITKTGNEGRGPGELTLPTSVVGDHKGYVLISDLSNAKISVWDSNYNHIKDIHFPPGWDTEFKKNSTDLFVRTFPSMGAPGPFNAVKIFKIGRDFWKIDLLHEFNNSPQNQMHHFFTAWSSKWDVSDEEILYVTGDASDSKIYMLDSDGKQIGEFGRDVTRVELTEKEKEEKIQRARRVSANPEALAESSSFKPVFINIEIDEQGYIWAHRNKAYAQKEEFDIYTSSGEYIKTITLPASESEYRMLEIDQSKILFRVNHPDGSRALHIYRINRSD